jgi:oligoendopeptidase F
MSTINLPAWDNSTEYSAVDAADFRKDVERVETITREIDALNRKWANVFALPTPPSAERAAFVADLQKISTLCIEGYTLAQNLQTFVNCETSIDSKNAVALKAGSRLLKMQSDLQATLTLIDLYLVRCEEDMFEAYLKSPHTEPERFFRTEERKRRDRMLSTDEERLLLQMRAFAATGWGEMYDAISGNMLVKVEGQGEMGLAQASALLRSKDEPVRRDAYRGIQSAWKTYEQPVAAVLNNLAGYRLEEYRQRSRVRPMDFLEGPLTQARIERGTLDAMYTAIEQNRAVVARGLKVMAKCFGKKALDPWDFLAPAPRAQATSFEFETAFAWVTEAFTGIDPEMGRFVTMMRERNWIDARVLPNKRPGAYCTGFPKSRTPRVFQTFVGSYREMSTLAHELGHAWHSWVTRDLPLIQQNYPMTLAETASIFAETALADHLGQKNDDALRFEVAYAQVSDAVALLANISARFEFEKNFYEARKNGSLTPAELSALMDKAWRKYFGEHISETEEQYWMTKLHFSIPEVSFYNYPYTFGYLFSLGIYGQRLKTGAEFSRRYIDILRDTGRMSAEDLIAKHLGADIRQPDFWNQSLKVVADQVSALERAVD